MCGHQFRMVFYSSDKIKPRSLTIDLCNYYHLLFFFPRLLRNVFTRLCFAEQIVLNFNTTTRLSLNHIRSLCQSQFRWRIVLDLAVTLPNRDFQICYHTEKCLKFYIVAALYDVFTRALVITLVVQYTR